MLGKSTAASAAAALWMVSALGLAGVAMATDVPGHDTCDIGGGGNDIDTLSASYDIGSDEITVDMLLCSAPGGGTKYRVHFDHTAPFATDADRNGDQTVDGSDFCVTTSDDTMMRRSHKGNDKDTGPGIISADTNTLTFTVPVDDLNPSLALGDTVYIWADTQHKGIKDRAPNTEGGDGCAKPEVLGEVLALVLSPPDKTVFLTSTTSTGDLGGLAGADAICQGLADTAGIGGGRSYLAWLSDDTDSPATRFTQATVPYLLTNGDTVANDYADLTDGSIQNPINVDESGGGASSPKTWSNTGSFGTLLNATAAGNCNIWSEGSSGTGLNGLTGSTGITWASEASGSPLACTNLFALYCFEQ